MAKVNETEAFCQKKSCVDWRQHTCVAGFGLSNGGQYCDYFENTKCCKSCNSTCLRAEVEKQVEDTLCGKIGGECKVERNFSYLIKLRTLFDFKLYFKHESNFCDGYYSFGACSLKDNERQCCIPKEKRGKCGLLTYSNSRIFGNK